MQLLDIKHDYIDWTPEPCFIYIFPKRSLPLMETNCVYVLLHPWILAYHSFLKACCSFLFLSYIKGPVIRWHNTLYDKGKYCRDPWMPASFWLSVHLLSLCSSQSWLNLRVDYYFYFFCGQEKGRIDFCPFEHGKVSFLEAIGKKMMSLKNTTWTIELPKAL